MKKALACLPVVLFAVALLTGCAYPIVESPAVGIIYTEVEAPIGATSNAESTKVGTLMCESILGLIAIGDASIEAAMQDGEITKIHHIDHYSRSILGVYGVYQVRVYGE